MANQLKDFMSFFFSSLPVQHYILLHSNQALHTALFQTRQTAMKRSNRKAKSNVVLNGERHLELPATSLIIPRKNQQREVYKRFPHLNE